MKQGIRIKTLIKKLYSDDIQNSIIHELKWSNVNCIQTDINQTNVNYSEHSSTTYNFENSYDNQIVFLTAQTNVSIIKFSKSYNVQSTDFSTDNVNYRNYYKTNKWFAHIIFHCPTGYGIVKVCIPFLSIYSNIKILNRSFDLAIIEKEIYSDTNYSNISQSLRKSCANLTRCLKSSKKDQSIEIPTMLRTVSFSSVELSRTSSNIPSSIFGLPSQEEKKRELRKHPTLITVKSNKKTSSDGTIDDSIKAFEINNHVQFSSSCPPYIASITNGDVEHENEFSELTHFSFNMKMEYPKTRSILRNGKYNHPNYKMPLPGNTPHISFAPNNMLVSVFEYPAPEQYQEQIENFNSRFN